MKNMLEIIKHLKNNPQFGKINSSQAIKKFIELLPAKLNKGVKFGYVRNNILFFVLTHPVYKMEFEYNKALIKSILKTYKQIDVQDIKFFVTNVIEKKEIINNKPDLYKERSHGIFDNKIQNPNLSKKLEAIRNIIKKS